MKLKYVIDSVNRYGNFLDLQCGYWTMLLVTKMIDLCEKSW